MKKYLYFTLLIISQSMYSQFDTTAYYLQSKDLMFTSEIGTCIKDLNAWSKEKQVEKKGIITVKCQNDIDNKSLTLVVTQIYALTDIFVYGTPDYYSYIKSSPVFWYLGKNKIIPPDRYYARYIRQHFAKYVFDNLALYDMKYIDSLNCFIDKLGNKSDISEKPADFNTKASRIESPVYTIKRTEFNYEDNKPAREIVILKNERVTNQIYYRESVGKTP